MIRLLIHERIKARRKELGLTAEKVADALGVSRATIYRYESSDIEKVSINALVPLSKVLKCTPTYLMGWDDDPGNPNKENEEVSLKTMAAHAIDDLTEEEQKELIDYAKYLKSKRKKD